MRNLTKDQIAGAYSAAGDIAGMLASALAPKLNVPAETLVGYYTSDECLSTMASMYARRVVGGMCRVDAAVEVSKWLKGCTIELFTERKVKAEAAA